MLQTSEILLLHALAFLPLSSQIQHAGDLVVITSSTPPVLAPSHHRTAWPLRIRQAWIDFFFCLEGVSSYLMIMEPKHSAEMCKHLEKQNQALMGTYRAMSHELYKLQVEEETIMRELYELMSAEGLLPKHKKEKQLERDAKESTPVGKQWTEP
ncbi:hypothetical protein SETIT_3G107500v2 [Setaria italica]|uniref:Uncharacterized protein n=2 Tax=Setaria italica TaxID=4555 RepID=A0A368QDJ7_SETIT|nr:uncharacterized protein LOC111256676 [Setaria italica]RCV16066.1 hypothetical protein SETIT_3G107500v2 [Setaria italica]